MYSETVPAIHQAAEETEQQLIDRAQQALSSNWTIGKCASIWCERYANGRTDADFADLIGASQQQVNAARRVFERFADVYSTWSNLTWSHFKAAVSWEDAAECLQWAEEISASVREMKAWRRALHGEDLTQPADDRPMPHPEPVPQYHDTFDPADFDEPQPESTPDTEDDPVIQLPAKCNSPPLQNERSPIKELIQATMTVTRKLTSSIESLEDAERKNVAKRLRSAANKLDPPSSTGAGKRFLPPTVNEVRTYCSERENNVDPEAFYDFYVSVGWRVGSKPMKDWQAAVRTWERRDNGKSGDSLDAAFNEVFG